MSVTAAAGFVASGVHARIRREKKDLAIVRSLPRATGAAMWTQNRVQAAPVLVSKAHLELAQPQAVVINCGVANARTGERGELDALAPPPRRPTPRPRRRGGARPLDRRDRRAAAARPRARRPRGRRGRALGRRRRRRGRGDPHDGHAREDRRSPQGPGFTVGGMAKGSGMIHPNLATMLAVVTTDYPLEPGEAIDFLRPAVDASFNAISVDGECSTNDAVVLLSSGAARRARRRRRRGVRAALRTRLHGARRADRRRRRGRDVVAEIAVTGARRPSRRRRRSRAGSPPRRS